jgi:hypothetical protein
MFEASKLKIKRANKHISEFQEMVKTFVKSDFYSFGIETDANTGQNILRFKVTADPSWELPLILGDAIHNLRAALDLAYVELIVNIGKEPTDWTTFRVWDDRDKLVSTLSKGILKGSDGIIKMLADEICAYKGGNALLTALDGLDIDDKHLLLIPVFSVAQLRHVDAIIRVGNADVTMHDCTVSVGQGGVLNMMGFSAGGRANIQSKGQPAINVFFGKGTRLEGQPIIPTLAQFTQLVGGILETFDKAILAERFKHGVPHP